MSAAIIPRAFAAVLVCVLGVVPARAEQKVRTFNVSVAHHRDLVIFSVDEATQATVAYLLAPGGKLRKAVSYQIGAEPRQLSAAEARAGFAAEVRYWSDRAREGVLSPAH